MRLNQRSSWRKCGAVMTVNVSTMSPNNRMMGNRKEGYKPNDSFYTPSWVFEKLGISFDLDVAAPESGVDWIPAEHYFTEKTDGLSSQWTGNVWMNPPFSQSKAWVTKFMEHRHGIALLPASKAKWFVEIWSDIDGMTWLPYDLKFLFNGRSLNGIFMPCGLFAYGEENVAALKNIGKVR